MSEAAAIGGEGGGEGGGVGLGGTPAPTPTTVESGGQGGGTGNWLDGFSPDFRANPSITKFQNADELARGYLNAQKAISGEKMPAPRDDWSESDWNAHYQRLGRPASSKDYDLSGFEVPEGVEWSDEYQNAMLDVMHKHGANSELVKDVLKTQAQFEAEASGSRGVEAKQLLESGIKQLRNEWGKSFDPNIDLAMRAWRSAAGDGFQELAAIKLDSGIALGDDPRIIKLFANLGNKMSEHGLVGGEKTQRSTLSPSEAANEIAKLKADSQFKAAWLDGGHPEHALAMQRIDDLTRMQVASE